MTAPDLERDTNTVTFLVEKYAPEPHAGKETAGY